MRANRLIFLFLLIVGCKATVPTSTITYEEDLSVYRPDLLDAPSQGSQDSSIQEIENNVPLTGHIKNELDSISAISYEQNKKGKLVDGFIYQIYLGNSSEEARNVKEKADQLFPELKAEIFYKQPTFRVKCGSFTNRLEANRVFKNVKKSFPRSLLIPSRFTLSYE